MNWRKKTIFIILATILPIFVLIIAFEFSLKTFANLGQPIVYDAHPLWGYSLGKTRCTRDLMTR